MRRAAALLAASCALLCGCHGIRNPYVSNRDPNGTPADRTGGASAEPYIRGGGPYQSLSPTPAQSRKSPE